MKSISKNKISLALALGICLCAPQSTWAAEPTGNTGGVLGALSGKPNDYVGSIDGVHPTNTHADVTIRENVIGKVYGGYDATNNIVSNNKVTIKQGTVGECIYGGYSEDGSTSHNTVRVMGGSVAFVVGGYAMNGDATYNTVEISGGSFADRAEIGAGIGGGSSNVTNNTLIIKGGTIGNDARIGGGTGKIVNNNTVTIEGNPTFGTSVRLMGGFPGPGSVDIRTGNRLNIYTSGISVKTVDNFQHYDLAIDKDKTTLTVDDALTLESGDTISSSRVLSELNVGDKVNLLKSTGGLDIDNAQLINGKAKQGILFDYGYELAMVNGELVANIISKEGNTQSMSVADGQLAAMGMLRSGADLVASAAMDNAAKANSAYDVFGALNYTNISMNSVSNIDVQGSSMLVGMGRNIQHTHSNLTIGAFLESGWGTYESSLGVARAKGHTNYYGVGILARSNNNSGLYTEGSIRVGKIGNTYSGNTIDDGTYDVSSTYYGLHLGIGKINQINDKTSTDIYLKYFYAHEGGTDANVAGDKFNFDSINSHRIRVGGRLNSTNKNIKRYVGLAYEYEFSGKATATAYGVDIATPTAKGSSGILELGLVYKPATDSKFSMDMGVNGYVGKRKGLTGNITLNWGF